MVHGEFMVSKNIDQVSPLPIAKSEEDLLDLYFLHGNLAAVLTSPL